MKLAIVDYGSGNLHSAAKAFERAAMQAGTGHEILVTSLPEDIRAAERIVLPGVGAYADCLSGLNAVEGMTGALADAVLNQGKPFLGICVGMQLLSERGFEHGVTHGLGWIKGDVKQIEPGHPDLKIPHMGWNVLHQSRDHPLLDAIPTGADGWHAYFVHSFALMNGDARETLAETEYGQRIPAIVVQGNIAGTQFHPEKSQKLGLALITNFLQWRP